MTLRRIKGKILWAKGFALFVLRRYQRDRASGVAASLSYTSLLSLVPLMAVALAMLTAFPVFRKVRGQIQDWVFANFVPAVGDAVQTQIEGFIANAGRLSAAGIVGLAVSAVMLLVTMETALNGVFRVSRARSPLSRLLVYWTCLTLGPLLLGASVSLQGYLTAVTRLQMGRTALDLLAMPLPTLLSVAAFTVLFALVPNRTVRPRDAMAGGVAAGLLFAVLRWGFAAYVIHSGSYASVYGAVAAVPILLFWMFLSWAVVLMGAEVTAALPEWRAGLGAAHSRAAGERRLTLALAILSRLHEAAIQGHGAVSRRRLLEATAAAEADLAAVLRRLTIHSFVAPTVKRRVVLGRDLTAVTLADLVEALDLAPGLDEATAATAPWRPRAEEHLQTARQRAGEALAIPLADLLAPAPPAES